MPTINQLSVLSSPNSGDQIPVYSPNNGDARRMSIGALLQLFQQQFASPTMATNVYQVADEGVLQVAGLQVQRGVPEEHPAPGFFDRAPLDDRGLDPRTIILGEQFARALQHAPLRVVI